MPYRRRSNRRKMTRRSFRRSKPRRGRRSNYNSGINIRGNKLVSFRSRIIPDRMRVKMVFNTFFVLNGSTAIGESFVIRMNSLFDPDQTGAGGQPTGRDQWANFYNKYCVYASALRVDFVNDVSPAGQVIVVPMIDNSLVSTTDVQDYTQYPYNKLRTLAGSGAQGSVTIRNFCRTSQIYGVRESSVLDSDNFKAIQSTNPTNQCYWVIGAVGVVPTAAFQVTCNATITYYVELSARVNLTDS